MYLSRIVIDLNNRRAMQAMQNPEIMHGMVESCFPGMRDRRLWRLDELNGQTWLLILSADIPDLSPLAAQISPCDAQAETRDYQRLLDRILTGSTWHFRLRANPVVSEPCPGEKRGKIKAITIAEHQREWLVRQGEKNGFRVAPGQYDVVYSDWMNFRNKGRNLSVLSATFEGVLTVTDDALFRKALTEGIGRGKAYGQGMMTVVSLG